VTEPARTRVRFPEVPAAVGHYESMFLTLSDPDGGRAVWIRYTVHRVPGGAAVGSLWCTAFDRAWPAPRAAKVTLPAAELGAGAGEYLHIGSAVIAPGRVTGAAVTEQCAARWELAFTAAEPPFDHLPRAWMYGARLPRTKTRSPYPAARFTGTVTVDGAVFEVADWPGTIGHNWGSEHAQRWIWLRGTVFAGEPESWLEVVLGRLRLGPASTPWLGNGVLRVGGERIRLAGLGRTLATRVAADRFQAALRLPGAHRSGVEVTAVVSAPPGHTVAWIYRDPGGSSHYTTHCAIADLEVRVRRPGRPDLRLHSAGGASYEYGGPDLPPGVAVQPFPDP
jgi:hypothetical protein